MSADFLDKYRRFSTKHRAVSAGVFIAWMAGSFIMAQIFVALLFSGLYVLGVNVNVLNIVILTFVASLFMYAIALVIAIGIPTKLYQWSWREVRKRVGLTSRLHYMHSVIAVLGFVAYALLSYGLLWLAMQFLPGFNATQEQSLGFHSFHSWFEAGFGFLAFVVLAPIAEELFFRGFLFGGLRRRLSFVPAMLITSVLFGLAHGQLNVGLDTFALSLVLCFLYEGTGSIWTSMALHMIKNGLAFSFLLSASSLQ